MTKKRQLVFGIGDITELRIRCRKEQCQREILVDLERRPQYALPTHCPFCSEPWHYAEGTTNARDAIDAISGIRSIGNGDAHVELSLVIPDDPDDE